MRVAPTNDLVELSLVKRASVSAARILPRLVDPSCHTRLRLLRGRARALLVADRPQSFCQRELGDADPKSRDLRAELCVRGEALAQEAQRTLRLVER